MTTPATVPVQNATMAATLVGRDITRQTSSSTSETSSSTEYHNRITSDGRISASYEYSFSGPLGSTFTHHDYLGQWWIVDSGVSAGRHWARVAIYWYDSTDAEAVGTVDSFTIATSDGVDFTIDDVVYTSTAIADVTDDGADTVDASSAATLGPTLLGKGGNDVLIGHDDHQNQILGGDGNDRLEGRGGDDTLYGQLGDDTLDGGSGVDLAFLFSARDQFTVTAAGGGAYLVSGPEGSDRLVGIEYVQFDTAAPVAIDTLVSTGPTEGDDTLTGTAAADRIDGLGGNDSLSGLAGDDTLIGGGGRDTLDGGAGADSMTGGAGNDAYVIDDAGDRVVEVAAGGTDRVTSRVAFTLGAEVENLTLSGSAAIGGTGNSLANRVTGNGAANSLRGAGGNDTLAGQGGNDTLTGGAGRDVFVLGSAGAADTVKDFASGRDHLRVSQGAFPVGDGDTNVDGAVTRGAPGGFAPSAELVVFTSNIAGSITAAAAASRIGSATTAYAVGDTALFMVDNGAGSALFLFTAADANAVVAAGELQLLASLAGTPSTTTGDLLFGG